MSDEAPIHATAQERYNRRATLEMNGEWRDGDLGSDWRLWVAQAPANDMEVEFIRIHGNAIMGSGRAVASTIPPEWNINGVWWREVSQ